MGLLKTFLAGPRHDFSKLLSSTDEGLAGGTGSALLDAFIAAPVSARLSEHHQRSRPEYAAIAAASPTEKGDLFARLSALTLQQTQRRQRVFGNTDADRIAASHRHSLQALWKVLAKDEAMILPSAAVAALYREEQVHIASRRATCYGVSDLSLVGALAVFLRAAARAEEVRLDPEFVELLEAALANVEKISEGIKPELVLASMNLARSALHLLGRLTSSFARLASFDRGLETARDLVAGWERDLSPLLWSYIAARLKIEPRPVAGKVEALAEMMAGVSPRERGEFVETLCRLGNRASETAPGSDWSYDTLIQAAFGIYDHTFGNPTLGDFRDAFRLLFEKLVANRCEFSSAFAIETLRSTPRLKWPGIAAFGKSVAAALPRNDEARAAVEAFLGQTLGGYASRKLERLDVDLREAVSEPGGAASNRAAAAEAAFVAAFEKMRSEADAAAKRLQELDQKGAQTVKALARFAGAGILKLDGLRGLFALAVFAAKAGAPAGRLRETLGAIEATVAHALANFGNAAFTRGVFDRRDAPAPARFDEFAGRTRAWIDLFASLDADAREAFHGLEDLAARAPNAAQPTQKWRKEAEALALGPQGATLRAFLLKLIRVPEFGAADNPFEPDALLGQTSELRRAFVWLFGFWPADEVVRPLRELALQAFAPSHRSGPQHETLGNACLYALSELADGAGLSAIARIGARTRYPKVRQRINALFEQAAEKAGRARAEIEEGIAPFYEFDADGLYTVPLAGSGGQAELRLDIRGKAEIVWRDGDGKALKAASVKMKEVDAARLKEIRETVKEIEADYGLEVKRVERLYRRDRVLEVARWRESYVEHAFIGPMCRRLIWRAETPAGVVSGLWRNGAFEDTAGRAHDIAGARVKLWHPIEATADEALAWRERLAALGIDQPFRQAWRETYRVTDAERATAHYSNRFAGHFVRQHQFMALARLNDWSCRHRMWQDVKNNEPTYTILPEFGVYAEYWTEGAGGEDPPVAESSAYLFLETDRVAFHRLNAGAKPNKVGELRGERLPVDQIPPLAFSEIMRACDLFVSVATIARDPEWLDRGADAEHPNAWWREANRYWGVAARADLSGNAEVRRDILAKALPALGLGQKLRLGERYLQVEGKRGAYRVHLGSGAAFHADGRHICIVPAGAPKKLVLPYEGDEMLALILSKALLLMRDDKIDDPVILRQL